MNITIRRAEPRDVPRMLELVRELALFERAPEEVTVTLEHMLDAGFGSDPVWVGWVAEVNDSEKGEDGGSDEKVEAGLALPSPFTSSPPSPFSPIVGMAICYERYSTWAGRRLYLEDIIVTEAARGQGIGERLFRACAAYAVERGHSGMVWQVLDWNKDAVRFYERFGTEFDKEWWNGSLERERLKAIAEGR